MFPIAVVVGFLVFPITVMIDVRPEILRSQIPNYTITDLAAMGDYYPLSLFLFILVMLFKL